MRWRDLRGLDLRAQTSLVQRLSFNQQTRSPPRERMPGGSDAGTVMTNAMNPGLGLRELHRQGITGRGVSVAVIELLFESAHVLPGGEKIINPRSFIERLRREHAQGTPPTS